MHLALSSHLGKIKRNFALKNILPWRLSQTYHLLTKEPMWYTLQPFYYGHTNFSLKKCYFLEEFLINLFSFERQNIFKIHIASKVFFKKWGEFSTLQSLSLPALIDNSLWFIKPGPKYTCPNHTRIRKISKK